MILAEIRNLIILSVDINMGKKEFLDTAGRGGFVVVVVYRNCHALCMPNI